MASREAVYSIVDSVAAPGTTVGTWFFDKVLPSVISGAVIAILGGLVIAKAIERYRGQRDHLNRALDALRSQLSALQKVAALYWASSFDPKESPAQEAEIEYLIHDISSLCAACAPHLWKARDSDGPKLFADLASAATGPGFGVARRKKEPRRGREVAIKASALARRLTHDRSSYFSNRTLVQQLQAVRWLWSWK